MKKLLAAIFCSILIISLTGCEKFEKNVEQTSAISKSTLQCGDKEYNIIEKYRERFNTKPIKEDAPTKYVKGLPDNYFYSQREVTGSALCTTTIEDIDEKYGLDYLRISKDIVTGSDFVYSVHPVSYVDVDKNSKNTYLVVTYNMDGYVIDTFYSSKINALEEYSQLTEYESTFDDVKELDFDANIDDTSNLSYHKCWEGMEVCIKYKQIGDEYVVSGINYNDDKTRIIENMLESDLELFA